MTEIAKQKQLKHTEGVSMLNVDDSPTGHQANETAIISPSALVNMRESKYLDSWATTETTGNVSTSKLLGPVDVIMTTTSTESNGLTPMTSAVRTESDSYITPGPNHKKKESTIKGGWWKEQEHFGRDLGAITNSLSTALSAAKEERSAMMQILETLQSKMSTLSTPSTMKGLGSKMDLQSESEEMSWSESVRSMESKLKQYHSKTMQELSRMDKSWADRMNQMANEQEMKQRRKSLIWNDDDGNDGKQVLFVIFSQNPMRKIKKNLQSLFNGKK